MVYMRYIWWPNISSYFTQFPRRVTHFKMTRWKVGTFFFWQKILNTHRIYSWIGWGLWLKTLGDATSIRTLMPGWWFQIFFIFTATWCFMIQFDEHIFQTGWFNHHLEFNCRVLYARIPQYDHPQSKVLRPDDLSSRVVSAQLFEV